MQQIVLLAEIVADVYTIEIIPELGNAAATRLEKSGYDNVHVKVSDGYFGWPEHGPYDAIIVTAAAEFVPPPLLEQLKEGGKIVAMGEGMVSLYMTSWQGVNDYKCAEFMQEVIGWLLK